MKLFAFVMPFFAVLTGALGCYFRKQELLYAFESNGFPMRNAVQSTNLITLSAAVLLVFFLFSLISAIKRKSFEGYENVFGTETLAYPVAFLLIGLVWFGATVKYSYDLFSSGAQTASGLYFLVLSALASVSTVMFSIMVYQDPQLKGRIAFSIVPVVFLCFWLILMYRQNASNPFLLGYIYMLLAIMLSALSFYFAAGYAYNKSAPGKTLLCSLAATYFCFVTLADAHDISVKIILVAILASNVTYSSSLIRGLQRKDGFS